MAEPPNMPLVVPISIHVLLAVSALDLTTSLIPTPADHLWPIEPKPTWMLVLQAVLLVVLLALVVRRRREIARAIGGLPLPRPALIVLGAYLTAAAGHVVLRAERYPFSPVTMFSSGVREPSSPLMQNEGYALMHPEGIEVISWLREGNVIFARHGFGFDYKAGWVMHMYAYSHSSAKEIVEDQLATERSPAPLRVSYEYRRSDGRLRLPPGQRELP